MRALISWSTAERTLIPQNGHYAIAPEASLSTMVCGRFYLLCVESPSGCKQLRAEARSFATTTRRPIGRDVVRLSEGGLRHPYRQDSLPRSCRHGRSYHTGCRRTWLDSDDSVSRPIHRDD